MSQRTTLGFSLNRAQRSTLHALVTTVLSHLLQAPSEASGLVTRIEDRLRGAPPDVTKDLATALSVIGSRTGGLLVTGLPIRFADNSGAARKQVFERWGTSAVPLARSVHQALRRLILTSWYSTPHANTELGVRPPLHGRAPEFSWEGPLPGQSRDDEPIAREPEIGIRASWIHPRRTPAVLVVSTPEESAGERTLTADVVIVGTGAGGSVAAARFAGAGREVVILEEGEYLRDHDFTENEGEMVPRLFAEQAMRATSDASVTLLQGGAVGGGTTVNWMLMLPPLDHVLEEWEVKLRLPGLSARELAPHLDRVGEEVHARLVPPDAHSPANRAILEGAAALGWRARSAMINAKECVRAGTCSLGCRFGAKQDARLTWLPRALAAGARLFTGASVDRVDVIERSVTAASAPRKRVRATIRDPRSGDVRGHLTVEAPVVVLAAGAVGTPVILQRSGLGGGGVGRYLRLHPTTAVMGHYATETYPLAGIPQSALCDEFMRRDRNGYGFWIEGPALLPALASAAISGFGDEHRSLMGKLMNTSPFIVLVRDGSGTDASMGSVMLGRTGRVRIRYAMSVADRENLHLGIEAAARLHLAAGAREAVSLHTPLVTATDERGLRAMRTASVAPNRVGLFSAHVNGTCRLGVNPSSSGCAPSGERHGVRGLYVMDGSLLPTAPGVNPQWTIMALASLLAERAMT